MNPCSGRKPGRAGGFTVAFFVFANEHDTNCNKMLMGRRPNSELDKNCADNTSIIYFLFIVPIDFLLLGCLFKTSLETAVPDAGNPPGALVLTKLNE